MTTCRLRKHEQGCSGLRWHWHTLSGYHVWLADWDWQESHFLYELACQRVDALRALYGYGPLQR